jgi:hypothetical protein
LKQKLIEEIKDSILTLTDSIYKIDKGEMKVTRDTTPLNILFLSKDKK